MSHYLDEALQAVADLKCADCQHFFAHQSGNFNLGRCRHPEAEMPLTRERLFAAAMREQNEPCGLAGTLWLSN